MERFEINNYFLNDTKKSLADKWYIDGFQLSKLFNEFEERLCRELMSFMNEDAFLHLGIRVKTIYKALIYLLDKLNFIEHIDNELCFFGYSKSVISNWIDDLSREDYDNELIHLLDTILEYGKDFPLRLNSKLKEKITKEYIESTKE